MSDLASVVAQIQVLAERAGQARGATQAIFDEVGGIAATFGSLASSGGRGAGEVSGQVAGIQNAVREVEGQLSRLQDSISTYGNSLLAT